MERCPSWPKEHDWKSCVRLKRTVGSNPTLSATEKEPERLFFCGGESGITHLCIFKCTGCASLQSKPDEPDKSNGVGNLNKNKVCAEG